MSLPEQFNRMHDVGELYLKGFNPTEIAQELSLTRNEALSAIKDWKQWVTSQSAAVGIKERILDILNDVEQHYKMVVKEAWETVQQADDAGQLGTKVAAMKLAATTDKDRTLLFQALLADADSALATELAELEEKYETLKGLLRSVANDCPDCKQRIFERLAEVSEEAEVIDVESETD